MNKCSICFFIFCICYGISIDVQAIPRRFPDKRISNNSTTELLESFFNREHTQITDSISKGSIPISFSIKKAGYVTLVIEQPNGFRVRNLVSEQWFPAGKNIVWWDGMSDLARDADAANHGLYQIPQQPVSAGAYTVRGLVRDKITTHYEFSVYTTGTPPWNTADHTGAWLANHTPPMATVFLPSNQSPTGQPAVYLGCFVTEGGPDGLAWVDLEGHKRGGKRWLGGNWTAAPYLARDAGSRAIAGDNAYAASVWNSSGAKGDGELRVSAITTTKDMPVIVYPIGNMGVDPHDLDGIIAQIGGMAVNNGLAVVSLSKKNQLIFIDIKSKKVLGFYNIKSPQGLAFDAKGGLLVLSETNLLRFDMLNPGQLSAPKTLITSHLIAPFGITTDNQGQIYISDKGNSCQIKVFTPDGKLIRAIGKPGAPQAGPYDPLHMNNPAGITIDSKQHLWVTEQDFFPKRVSVWTLDGKLVNAFYGPAKYGGGGTLDQNDKTLFYYSEAQGAMKFKLDWNSGTYQLKQIYYRPSSTDIKLPVNLGSGPEKPLYFNNRRYFTNCYTNSPTNGMSTAFLFIERNGIAQVVAGMGLANDWDILKGDKFKSHWPPGVDLNNSSPNNQTFFIWSDLNEDGMVQPDEVAFQKTGAGGVTVMSDLSFCIAHIGDSAMQFYPVSFTTNGVPVYNITKGKILVKGVLPQVSTGGNQVLTAPNAWTVITLGVTPFNALSISGVKDGTPKWSYPDLWPGLHASHQSPTPDRPGELIGTTRLLGDFIKIKNSTIGRIWAINGNEGNVYLFTDDGLFITTLFKDVRSGKPWNMTSAPRNMNLDALSLSDENFYPTMTQTSDGLVYLVDGNRSSIIRLDGLQSIQPIPAIPLSVTNKNITQYNTFMVKTEEARQQLKQKNNILLIPIKDRPPVVDGKLDDWNGANWVDIDKRGVKANFNSNSKAYNVTAALAVSGDRLYAAYRTNDNNLLRNSGEMPVAPFKTGGALDLMIGADGTADPNRQNPVAGDCRIIITLIKNKPLALLYRAVVPGTKTESKIPFSSPTSTVTFDRIDDISSQIQFAGTNGNFEISIPISIIGLKPKAGLTIKGDIGILRGNGGETTSRVYWNNKATGIVADVPSEAMLTPKLWGGFQFKNNP
ncbi:hypothetical protein AB6735_00080 [Mucilaginibacter sp. RCC_168]|uniref:hypothetical protein n=1 Tax=Mucilaginibacter sp. RCC_168 TaxID=3239221 RepID=UPI003523BFB6